ncbi:hypothetical protein [Mesorhizobium sp. B2-3-4]|uniref:hypothetical protein n=1 Tax=Mesorhizobium sp. B2-3-4 TaxID=2589959 RepID=UPI00112D35B5|nr:hypothetical protein [Mesorhizobium sp. B2-3-4]TPM35623.1 hypothetical protein FJ967_19665 [Mesorhizobium sp. B2-3-4]
MQEAAKLLTALGDCIDAIEAYLAAAQRSTLDSLLAVLPAKSPAGSATMVMTILVYRELDARSSPH